MVHGSWLRDGWGPAARRGEWLGRRGAAGPGPGADPPQPLISRSMPLINLSIQFINRLMPLITRLASQPASQPASPPASQPANQPAFRHCLETQEGIKNLASLCVAPGGRRHNGRPLSLQSCTSGCNPGRGESDCTPG